jgi:hypothetical protein
MVEWYIGANNDTLTGIVETQRVAAIDAEAGMKREWGDAFDQNLAQAEDALRKFDTPEGSIRDLLIETNMRNDPRMIEFLRRVGRNLGEDIFHRPGGGPQEFVPTPTEAKEKIAALSSDETFAEKLTTKAHPEHAAAHKQWQDLHRLAWPEEEAPAAPAA